MNTTPDPSVLPTRILGVLAGFQRTAALKAAIELDLFTIIGGSDATADEIAARCGASPRGIRALCDVICLTGLLNKASERYQLSVEARQFLDARSPQYIAADAVAAVAAGEIAKAYENLVTAVRRGGTALSSAGTLAPEHPLWPQHARTNAPVGAAIARLLAQILQVGKLGPLKVLDVAAGHGHHGIAIARENPNTEIFAQDWPNVLEVAVENARVAGIESRYQTIPGDVFNVSLGDNYDLALITNFLPDFGPAECERMLIKIRETLKPTGRVVALQWVPGEDRLSPPGAPSLALSLLATTPNGDVYTYAEMGAMFRNAGFTRCELLELGPSIQRVVVGNRQ